MGKRNAHTMVDFVAFLGIAVAVLAGAALLGWLLGRFFLPHKYTGSASVRVDASEAVVWENALRDAAFTVSGDMCHKRSETVEVSGAEGSRHKCWTEDIGSSVVTVVVVESDSAQMRLRCTDSVVNMNAVFVIRLRAADGGGTNVSVSQTITVNDGTWHTGFFRLILFVSNGAKAAPRQLARWICSRLPGDEDKPVVTP